MANMSNYQKLVERNLSSEDLISEVKKHPALWNSETEEYGNKVDRRNAWRSITTKFIPEFDDKALAEKYQISKYANYCYHTHGFAI